MNKLPGRGDYCMTSGVDSGEKTLHTTSGNACKCSWEAKRGEKLQLMIRRHWEQLAPSERGKLYGDRLPLPQQRRRIYN